MKKCLGILLAMLLASLALTGALAEAYDDIAPADIVGEADAAEGTDVIAVPVDGDIPEEIELVLGIPEQQEVEEIGDILHDPFLDSEEPTSVIASSMTANDDNQEDFEIVNGVLVNYHGNGGDVIVPANTVAIGAEVFRFNSNVTSITIPSSVISIGEEAFRECKALTKVEMANGVISIGDHAFYECGVLSDIYLPDSLISIGQYAFYKCNCLTSINIPKSLWEIDYEAFSHCASLSSISIADGFTAFGPNMFQSCIALKSIRIPSSVYKIDNETFSNCRSINSVYIDSNNIIIEDDAFENIPQTAVFYTHCDTPATKWAEANGYTVVKSAHTPVTDPAMPTTCTESGLTEGSHCSVCNTILTAQQTIPAKGHTPVVDPAVPATCTETGLTEGSHCSVCGKVLVAQEVVPANGHTPVVDPAVPATLTKTGLTEGSHCSVCGKVLVAQEVVPKLISIKKCAITGVKDSVCTGKPIKPAPVVKYKGKKLKKGTDYTVSYKDNKAVGAATVTVTGKGKYGASVKKTFKINPKPVALSAVTAGSKQLTVKWKKGTGITGYELQYGLKSSFKSARKATVTNASTVKTVLKGLKANKTYYVRLRAYKTVKGKKYYSAWSKARSAKTKK